MIPRSQASTYLPARSANPSIPEAFNFSLAGLHISLNLFQFFILPLYLLPKSLWWSVFLIPIACLNNPFWALFTRRSTTRSIPSAGLTWFSEDGSPFFLARLFTFYG